MNTEYKYLNIKIPIKLFWNKKRIYSFLDCFDASFQDKLSFHFFFENGEKIDDILEIRMNIKEDKIENMKMFIEKHFGIIGKDEIKYGEYVPETNNYGDKWPIAEKIFEYLAKAAICIRTKDKNKTGELFRETKFIHCFLNQLGYDSLGEASFHNYQSCQMLIKYNRERDEL